MAFVIQTPGADPLRLAIGAAAMGADRGGGVFAFANRGGVEALFSIAGVADLLHRKRPYHLIVGTDAITDPKTLLMLESKVAKHLSLTVEVFYHALPWNTFHPKFSWFATPGGLDIVTGSGNLTISGLGLAKSPPILGNWEAFAVQRFCGADAVDAEKRINDWLDTERAANRLRNQADEDVRKRAMSNAQVRFTPERPAEISRARPKAPAAIPLAESRLDAPSVLIRELPKDRPGQADVGKRALIDFFGFEGQRREIMIQSVSMTNIPAEVHTVSIFVVKSQNYRIELEATKELEYTVGRNDERMILVAVRLNAEAYRYTIVTVGESGYKPLSKALGPVPSGRRTMRMMVTTVEDLLKRWPVAPPNLLPIEISVPERLAETLE